MILAAVPAPPSSFCDCMDQKAPPGRPLPAEFGSLSLARAYIDTAQRSLGSLDGDGLIDVLEHLARAYEEFPELELDRPRNELLEHLRSTTEKMPDRAAIPVLMYCAAASSTSSTALLSLVQKIVKSGNQSSLSEDCGQVIDLAVGKLRDRRQDAIGLLAEVIDYAKFTRTEEFSAFGDMLKPLLTDQDQPQIDSGLLTRALRSARRRLAPGPAQKEPQSRAKLLAMADRLRVNSLPERHSPNLRLGWPSGRVSFDEFLVQWPCEIELPVESNGTAFIDRVYQAILLRAPESAERDQFMRLLQNGTLTRSEVIEELLASDELRSLGRKLHVVFGTEVITEPGSSLEEQMPAATWPSQPASS